MKSTNSIQKDIISNFQTLDDDFEMILNYLIELGEKLDEFDVEEKKDDNLIKGCQSKVWLSYKIIDNKLFFSGDSNTSITKGLLSLLIKVFSNQTAEEIIKTKLFFINERFWIFKKSNNLFRQNFPLIILFSISLLLFIIFDAFSFPHFLKI